MESNLLRKKRDDQYHTAGLDTDLMQSTNSGEHLIKDKLSRLRGIFHHAVNKRYPVEYHIFSISPTLNNNVLEPTNSCYS